MKATSTKLYILTFSAAAISCSDATLAWDALFLWKARLVWPRWYNDKTNSRECASIEWLLFQVAVIECTLGGIQLLIAAHYPDRYHLLRRRDNWNCFTAGVPCEMCIEHRAVQLYTWMTTVRQAARAKPTSDFCHFDALGAIKHFSFARSSRRSREFGFV